MKIRLWCDSGANIKSRRQVTLDVEDLGYSEEEWRELPEEEKGKAAEAWAWDSGLEIGYEEVG